MRDIKFRGMRVRGGRWAVGYYSSPSCIFVQDLEDDIEIKPETVGQFTGREDKNYNDVYEGDVVDDHYIGKGVVEMGRLGWRVKYYDSYDVWLNDIGKHFGDFVSSEWGCVEIIGNIHENPELMKG